MSGYSGGGGGYMAGSQGSQMSPGGSKGGPATVGVRPVTIRQIIDATREHSDSEYLIDGNGLTQITFVGQLMNKVGGAANLQLKIVDGTGSIEARMWIQQKEDADEIMDLPDMAWVRVLASLRSFNDKKNVHVARVWPIKDHNEIFYAHLEALSVHLYFVAGPLGADGVPQLADGAGAPGGGGAGVPSAYKAGGAGGKADDKYAGFTDLQKRILIWIQQNTVNDDGVTTTEIALGVNTPGVQAEEIGDAIDFLQDNGHIYSTIDDDHYVVSEET